MNGKDIEKHNEGIRNDLRRLYREMKYPKLEAHLGINRKYLWHFVNTEGYEPPPPIAAKLGWVLYETVAICLDCGIVHLKACPHSTPKKKHTRTPGGWVNARDPARAAKQLVTRAEYDIDELIWHLSVLDKN